MYVLHLAIALWSLRSIVVVIIFFYNREPNDHSIPLLVAQVAQDLPWRKFRSIAFISVNFLDCDSHATSGFRACSIQMEIHTNYGEDSREKPYKFRLNAAKGSEPSRIRAPNVMRFSFQKTCKVFDSSRSPIIAPPN